MRRQLASAALLALSSCGAGTVDDGAVSVAVTSVVPDRVSARGGAELTVLGKGFATPLAVKLGGRDAELLEVQPDALRIHAPRLTAGPADLALAILDDEPVVVKGAVIVESLAPTFVAAPPEIVEAPEAGEVRDAVAFDADADGDADLVLATDDGLRLLLGDGGAGFRLQRVADKVSGPDAPARPGGRGDIRALAVRPTASDPDHAGELELVACTGAGRDLRFRASADGLEEAGAMPLRAGSCRGIAVVDADGNGISDLALAIEVPPAQPALAVLIAQGDAFAFAESLTFAADGEATLGAASSADPTAVLAFERTTDDPAEGAAAARLTYTLTDLGPEAAFALAASFSQIPDRFELWARRDGGPVALRTRIVDGAGASFHGPEIAIDAGGWSRVAIDVAAWSPLGGDKSAPVAPVVELALVVRAEPPLPLEGSLDLDTLVALREGAIPWVVDDFERRSARHSWPSVARIVAGDLDGDGASDLVVLPGGGADATPVVLATRGAVGKAVPAYVESATPIGGSGPFVSAAFLDANRDGHLDLIVPSAAAQDRLLLGDGWGELLDTTAGALPIDWAEGHAVAVADFDLDGNVDVVIGNYAGADRLYFGRGDGRFTDVTPDFGFDEIDTAAVVVLDVDGDGDDDVVSVPTSGSAAPLVRVAIGADE
ncbi:MAG: VCBS repeat-containing protein [Myxococcota bacterium]